MGPAGNNNGLMQRRPGGGQGAVGYGPGRRRGRLQRTWSVREFLASLLQSQAMQLLASSAKGGAYDSLESPQAAGGGASSCGRSRTSCGISSCIQSQSMPWVEALSTSPAPSSVAVGPSQGPKRRKSPEDHNLGADSGPRGSQPSAPRPLT